MGSSSSERSRTWHLRNVERNREQSRRAREKAQLENPEEFKRRQQNSQLKYHFGITIDDYEQILKEQNNACFICERDSSEFNKRLAVDHDHKTGMIRGLLCTHCNHRILGRNRDPALFKRAAEYLDRNSNYGIVPSKKKLRRKVRAR